MADHLRRQIREAAAILVTGLATTGARVYQSRVYPLRDSDLPCLLVNTDDEDISNSSIDSMLLERTLQLRVRACQKLTANLDDSLDQMVKEVEQVLNASSLGGLCKPLGIQSIRIAMDDTLDKPVGSADMTFVTTYYTSGTSPDVSI
jgi:hypothetical protein